MHRSGTSAAAGLLSKLGLSTCVATDLLDDTRGNAKGHFESISMVRLNDELLAQMGRCWWCPPRWGRGYVEDAARVRTDPQEARRAFELTHPDSPWVWKDPRTVLTLPFWREALGEVPAVAVVRSALDVAASLHTRNKLRITHGVALWERYNRHLLSNLEGLPVILTRYDDLVDDPVAWSAQVGEFLASLGVACHEAPPGTVREFVDAGLRHKASPRSELLASFASCGAVDDALEASLGAWDCFEPPQLPDEAPWVEAELVAIGSWQRDRVPKPSSPAVSVLMVADAHEAAGATEALGRQLLPFMEGIVVVRGGAEGLLREAVPEEQRASLKVLTVAPGTTLGAARNAAVAAAQTELLDFRRPFAVPTQHWPPEVRRALAAGYAAVSPAIRWAGDAAQGYGLAFSGPYCNLTWLALPEDNLATVPLLAGACFAVRRDALEEVGGFDDELGAYDFDVYELSLRLWRIGRLVAVASQVAADTPVQVAGVGDIAASGELDWPSFCHDVVRLAALHLSRQRLALLLEGLRSRPGMIDATAAVLGSDAGERRAALLRRGAPLADPLLDADVPAGGVMPTARSAHAGHESDVAIRLPEVGDGDPADAATVARSARTRRALQPFVSVVAAASAPPAACRRLQSRLARRGEVVVGPTRAAGARRARGDVLVFAQGPALPDAACARGLAEAVVRRDDVLVAPALLAYGRRLPLGGLGLSPSLLDVRWLRAPWNQSSVQALPTGCVAMTRSLYERLGGYDEALEPTGWADVELSLRAWRCGAGCVVDPELVAPHVGGWWGERVPHWDDALFGLLRLAAIHLDAHDHARLIDVVASWRGFPGAVARVAAGTAPAHRARLVDQGAEPVSDVLRSVTSDGFGG